MDNVVAASSALGVWGHIAFNVVITGVGIWLFWALYVFSMGIYRAKLAGRLKGLNLVFAFPIVLLAVLVDVFSNIFIAPLLFWDWPRETLVTARLQRYRKHPNGWRRRIAERICEGMLDVFDPDGDHC